MPKYPQLGFSTPEGATTITLVRHGQSQAADPDEPFALVDGHGDPPLTELGHRQAAAVGEWLKDAPIDHIYVSSLTRTHETAAPLAAAKGFTPVVERDLREVFLGDWEGGVFRQKAEEQHPAVLAMREKGEWGELPGAETNEELRVRTTGAIDRIVERHPGEHIACFVHGGVIAALCGHAANTHSRNFGGTDNAAIHRFIVMEDRWLIRLFNDVDHLDGLRTPTAEIDQPA